MNRPREALDEQEDSSSLALEYGKTVEQENELYLQNERQKCEELSLVIQHIQSEISELRSRLSQRYWPGLEAQLQRLTIERDETLISLETILASSLCSKWTFNCAHGTRTSSQVARFFIP